MIDQLEKRRLFDVTLTVTGTLTINGTHGDDVITMPTILKQETAPDGSRPFVSYYKILNKNKLMREIDVAKVQRIYVNLFKGNDTFTANPDDAIRDTITGGAGDDSIICNAANDSVNGGTGNDTIIGNAGEDTIDGGDGNDSVSGGEDNDSIISGAGIDTLSGGDHADIVDFSARVNPLTITLDGVANDGEVGSATGSVAADFESIIGGAGADLIDASFLLKDSLTGQAQAEYIDGKNGKNTIIGGEGNDYLVGGVHNDSILGGAGDDTLVGHRGLDHLNGGAGNDSLVSGDDNQRDTLIGGGGSDSAYYDFLDIVGTNSISGNVFKDVNENQSRDMGEMPLVGWTVYLDRNNNKALDSNEVSVVTDVSGSYIFANVQPGTYPVRIVLQAGYHQTTPLDMGTPQDSGAIVVTLAAVSMASNVTGVNFGATN